MFIVSIDIGVHHFAYVLTQVNSNTFEITKVLKIDLINITKLRCRNCVYGNQKTHSHYVHHFIENHKVMLKRADLILIERQPPCGFNSVEQLLQSRFVEKVELISPNAMHKYFDINTITRDERKEQTDRIATPYLSHIPRYIALERKHDVSDAFCMTLFYCNKKADIIRKATFHENPFKPYVYDPNEQPTKSSTPPPPELPPMSKNIFRDYAFSES